MPSRLALQMIGGLLLLALVAPPCWAAPLPGRDLVREALEQFDTMNLEIQILGAARNLFWSLATISLVWTMGALILRQDIGEMLMELLRFVVVTGTYYWLLINASNREGGEGFVRDIVGSFFQMSNGSAEESTIRSHASGLLSRGLNIFYRVIAETHGGNSEDQFLSGSIAILILIMCALMAAQFVVALVMAWMLSYAGIFLLGFGGARWTSPIAISFYKHVVAVGVALLALSLIGVAATRFLDAYDHANESTGLRSAVTFPYLGGLLAAIVLMMVLSIRVPQILFTLVTGSPLGMFTGAATIAGHALAVGGTAAWSSAMNALPTGGGDAGSAHRRGADAVMDAVQRSAAGGGMSDAFHVNAGSDPFGITRSSDPHRGSRGGSAFAGTENAVRPATDSGHARNAMPSGGHVEAGTATSSSDRPMSGPMPVVEADPASLAASRTGSQETPDSASPDVATQRPDYEAELSAIEAAKKGGTVASVASDPMQPILDVETTGVELDTAHATYLPDVASPAQRSVRDNLAALQASGDERLVAEPVFDPSLMGDLNGLVADESNHQVVDVADGVPKHPSTPSPSSPPSADVLSVPSASGTTLQDAEATSATATATANEELGDIRVAVGTMEEGTTPAMVMPVDQPADNGMEDDSGKGVSVRAGIPSDVTSAEVDTAVVVRDTDATAEDPMAHPVERRDSPVDSSASPRGLAEAVGPVRHTTRVADGEETGDQRNSTQHPLPAPKMVTPEDNPE